MKLLQSESVSEPTLFGVYLPTDDEVRQYGAMREDYERRCRANPAANRSAMAVGVAARAFGLSVTDVQADRDQRQPDISHKRQCLMAFARVVSISAPHRNSWASIARAVNRSHAAVIHATHKYGAQIAAAMEMSR